MIKLEIKNLSMIFLEKLQKYEYLAGKEILRSNQKQIKEQAKFTCSPLRKDLKNKQNQLKIREKSKSKPLKLTKNNQLILIQNIINMNYCFQRKKKYLRI